MKFETSYKPNPWNAKHGVRCRTSCILLIHPSEMGLAFARPNPEQKIQTGNNNSDVIFPKIDQVNYIKS